MPETGMKHRTTPSCKPERDMGLKKGVTVAKLTDDLAVDILSRLPYKFYCRNKCVCKAWSAFSSDPHYCKKLPKKITKGFLHQSNDNSTTALLSLSQNDEEIDGILADVPHHEHLELLDCCNGLVLCKYKSSFISPSTCRFVVCNPATREWRILPDTHAEEADPHYQSIVAYDPSHSPHFYVFNFHLKRDNDFICGTSKLEIFSSHGAWLVDDSWNPDIITSWRPSHVFLQGFLYVATNRQVVVFKGFEAMIDGTPPSFGFIEFPLNPSFASGCFGKSSGTLHYALTNTSGSIVVWDLDCASDTWTPHYSFSIKAALGLNDLAPYNDDDDDDDDDGAEMIWFLICDYRIVALDMEKDVIFLFDSTENKLLSFSIFSRKLNELGDGFQHLRDPYFYYVPCYSELPSQEVLE